MRPLHNEERDSCPIVRHAAPRVPTRATRQHLRTFADWKQPKPCFVEIDLVAHCGDRLEGSFAHTLTLTDLASGWTECVALLIREGTLVVDAL